MTVLEKSEKKQMVGRMALVVHPKADTPELREAVNAIEAVGHDVSIRITNEDEGAEGAAQKAADEGYDTIVAVGGDGTLHRLVVALHSRPDPMKTALGLIPSGTGNDFANAAGIPLEPLDALTLITRSQPVPLDIGIVNGHPFINVATGGFAASVTTNTPDEMKKVFGAFAYMLTGLASVVSMEPHSAEIHAEDFHWEGKMYAIVVGNGRRAGGGFRVCDNARLDDGLLDLLIVPEFSSDRFFGILSDLMNLECPFEHQELVHARLKKLTVRSDTELQLNLDGEPLKGREFTFEVQRSAIRMHLPPDTPLLSNASSTVCTV